jgi:hypothetical protein
LHLQTDREAGRGEKRGREARELRAGEIVWPIAQPAKRARSAPFTPFQLGQTWRAKHGLHGKMPDIEAG